MNPPKTLLGFPVVIVPEDELSHLFPKKLMLASPRFRLGELDIEETAKASVIVQNIGEGESTQP